MPLVTNHKFTISGRLSNRDGRLFLTVGSVELFLLPGVLKQLTALNVNLSEPVEAQITGLLSFEGKNKKDGTRSMITKSNQDLTPREMALNIPSLEVVLDSVNILPIQSANFQSALAETIHEDLNSPAYDELFKRAYIPWTLEEEEIALLVYLKNRGGEYSDIMALAKEVSEAGVLNHSFDALEMRINSYRYLDRNSGVDGLHDRAQQTELLWQDFVEGRYVPDFSKLEAIVGELS